VPATPFTFARQPWESAPHRRERLWTLTLGPNSLNAHLRRNRDSWEVRLTHDGVFRYGERYPSRARALHEAEACRRDLEEKGWIAASRGEDGVSAIDPFQTFDWLRPHYGKVAAARDFASVSTYERWTRLREQVRQTPHANGPGRLDTLDRLETPRKQQLLDWLDAGERRADRRSGEDLYEMGI
jgi:hypothetical protein